MAFSTVSLEMAVNALKNPESRLSRPATITEEQVEELLTQAFKGKKLIKSKINAALTQANLRIPMETLQAALDSLVEQGVANRQERTSKTSGREYTLYGFGVSLESRPMITKQLTELLNSFGNDPFNLKDFLKKTKEQKVSQTDAQSWFEHQQLEGAIYQVNHHQFRRVA